MGIGHRPTLFAFHKTMLKMLPGTDGALLSWRGDGGQDCTCLRLYGCNCLANFKLPVCRSLKYQTCRLAPHPLYVTFSHRYLPCLQHGRFAGWYVHWGIPDGPAAKHEETMGTAGQCMHGPWTDACPGIKRPKAFRQAFAQKRHISATISPLIQRSRSCSTESASPELPHHTGRAMAGDSASVREVGAC